MRTDYLYVIDGAKERPDPCSRYQPNGVHGPSRVVAGDGSPGPTRAGAACDAPTSCIYELHVGTFTPEGTFDGIIPQAAVSRDLGVTAIELMPVAAVPGRSQLGLRRRLPLRAPQAYGGPDGLQRLVDACHATGSR